MKITKERNPYLQRILPDSPHKYSYEINSGKYLLIAEDGNQRVINKTGTFKPKFRKDFTGFSSANDRYQAAKLDNTALHFTPNLPYQKQKSYYTPTTRKFIGYAQLPYKIKDRHMPQFLSNPDQTHHFKNQLSMKKSQSEYKQKLKNQRKGSSIILQNASTTFVGGHISDKYFQTSYLSMTESKPLPKQIKKTCFNYRCKYLKNFTFDEKQKTEASTRFTKASANDRTLSKSFYDKQFQLQKKQFSAIQSIV